MKREVLIEKGLTEGQIEAVLEIYNEVIKGYVPKIDYYAAKNQITKLQNDNKTAAEKSDTVTEINQKVKLFISADINIDEGSIVVIEHLGRVREYLASGIPRVYGSHQEIMLVDSKCYA